MSVEKDSYFVAVKVFLEDSEGNLLIIKDVFGDWDLPGGRLREKDFDTPLEEVVERKMQEELGEALEYKLGEPIVFMRHQRNEVLEDKTTEAKRIFAVGYRGKYLGGEIRLGKNHGQFLWTRLEDFKPEDYFSGGWLAGVREYLQKR